MAEIRAMRTVGPNPKKQKAGWATLDRIFADAANTWIIHYSCEDIYKPLPNGRSPRITSIALRKLDSGQARSFSIHQIAEQTHIPFDEIEAHYDLLEKAMLDAFYDYIKSYQSMKYLHWNMRNTAYGFAAIEHRYRVLGGDPALIEDNRKIDISPLFVEIYGADYIAHHRIESLMEKNSIKPRDFLTGSQEAEAFAKKDYVALHQSTLRKADVFAEFVARAHDRKLKTDMTWWQMHGGNVKSTIDWLADNKIFTFIVGLAGLAGLYFAIFSG